MDPRRRFRIAIATAIFPLPAGCPPGCTEYNSIFSCTCDAESPSRVRRTVCAGPASPPALHRNCHPVLRAACCALRAGNVLVCCCCVGSDRAAGVGVSLHAVVLRLFFGNCGSRRDMVPNSVSYCRAEPFKVPAAAPLRTPQWSSVKCLVDSPAQPDTHLNSTSSGKHGTRQAHAPAPHTNPRHHVIEDL